jgi:hypothetical protein
VPIVGAAFAISWLLLEIRLRKTIQTSRATEGAQALLGDSRESAAEVVGTGQAVRAADHIAATVEQTGEDEERDSAPSHAPARAQH